MNKSSVTPQSVATEILLGLRHLRSRIREESQMDAVGLSMSQLAILHYLHRNGPATAAQLASREHVSQQAIAQFIGPLKQAGLVTTKPDLNDRRKTLIKMTKAGGMLRQLITDSRNAWLTRAIADLTDKEELSILHQAAELMEKLADSIL